MKILPDNEIIEFLQKCSKIDGYRNDDLTGWVFTYLDYGTDADCTPTDVEIAPRGCGDLREAASVAIRIKKGERVE